MSVTLTSPPTADEPAAATVGGPDRRPRRRLVATVAAALAAGGLVAATGYALTRSGDGTRPLGPGVVTVEVGIHHSRFDLGHLRVEEGTLVEFVVRNDDPIDHELVVGDAGVHRRHAGGTERQHPPVPGEVSMGPGRVAMTFYEFTEPGTVVYACHLPGHLAYGMTGQIEVVAAG